MQLQCVPGANATTTREPSEHLPNSTSKHTAYRWENRSLQPGWSQGCFFCASNCSSGASDSSTESASVSFFRRLRAGLLLPPPPPARVPSGSGCARVSSTVCARSVAGMRGCRGWVFIGIICTECPNMCQSVDQPTSSHNQAQLQLQQHLRCCFPCQSPQKQPVNLGLAPAG